MRALTKFLLFSVAIFIKVSFAVEYAELLDDYKGEEFGSSEAFGANKVIYLTKEEREKRRVSFKDGKIIDHNANPITERGIFVMDKNNNFYFSDESQKMLFHHSSIVAGNKVTGAGEIAIIDGIIININKDSGHYKPSLAVHQQVLDHLKKEGVLSVGIEGLKEIPNTELRVVLSNIKLPALVENEEITNMMRAYLKISDQWSDLDRANIDKMINSKKMSTFEIRILSDEFVNGNIIWNDDTRNTLSKVLGHDKSKNLLLRNIVESYSKIEGPWPLGLKVSWKAWMNSSSVTQPDILKMVETFNDTSGEWSIDKLEAYKKIFKHERVMEDPKMVEALFSKYQGVWDKEMLETFEGYLRLYPHLKNSISAKKYEEVVLLKGNITKLSELEITGPLLNCVLKSLIK